MMNPTDAEALAARLFMDFELDGWSFHWTNAKATFGQCRRDTHGTVREIRLSKPLTLLNDVDAVEDTLRHEIAHALAPIDAGHGPAWRAACAITGARPTRCFGREVATPSPRWTFRCDSCGREGTRERRPKREAFHSPCGRAGTLTWIRTDAS